MLIKCQARNKKYVEANDIQVLIIRAAFASSPELSAPPSRYSSGSKKIRVRYDIDIYNHVYAMFLRKRASSRTSTRCRNMKKEMSINVTCRK